MLDGPDVDSPVLEPVFFSDATAHQEAPAQQGTLQPALAPLPSVQDRRFVNTLLEAAPLEMEPGIIPSSPPSYTQVVAAPLVASMIPSPPLRRHHRNRPPPAVVPCCSARLAKKATNRPPGPWWRRHRICL
jgi:hypothetical protein